MYGNNFVGPFITPFTSYGPIMNNPMSGSMMRGIINPGMGITRPLGSIGATTLGGKGSGLLAGIRGLNWNSMLGNISKTLGVVKEAIPVVKEVGPMMNNMKSMIKIASVFKDETDVKTKKEEKETSSSSKETSINNISSDTKISNNKNEPNFFL